MSLKQKVTKIRSDGWGNFTTWLGLKGKDRTTNVKFCNPRVLSDLELSQLYQSNGLSKKIIDMIATEMTRQWFNVQGDDENLISAYLDDINAKKKILNLVRWARLYGGGIGVMGINDGRDLSQPVNINNIRTIEFIHVFDRTEISWDGIQIYNDPNDERFQQIQTYVVNSRITGVNFKVHESRLLRLDGETLPNSLIKSGYGWGDSVLQSCYNELKNIGTAYNATSNIIEDFIQTVLKIGNLANLMAADQDHIIQKRMNIIDVTRSVSNTIFLDGKDEYQKQASSVSGLDSLLDKFCLALSASTGIPYAILMGQSPSGLQATGDADIRMFYDRIKSYQIDWLQPELEKLIRYVFLAKDGPTNGVEPENWKICFNPLWQMDETETATYRKTIADTDAVYIDRGVLSPEEVALSRFGGGVYSAETVIDKETLREIPEPTQEETQSARDTSSNETE